MQHSSNSNTDINMYVLCHIFLLLEQLESRRTDRKRFTVPTKNTDVVLTHSNTLVTVLVAEFGLDDAEPKLATALMSPEGFQVFIFTRRNMQMKCIRVEKSSCVFLGEWTERDT